MILKKHRSCDLLVCFYIVIVFFPLQFNWLSPLLCYKTDYFIFESPRASVFPRSLQSIGEEAFSKTKLQCVVFENETVSIGEKAFYNTKALKAAYIPSSVAYIADDAFQESSLKVVFGIHSSTAQKWAADQGLLFILKDIWPTIKGIDYSHNAILISLLPFAILRDDKRLLWLKRRILFFIRSMRPQDRIELYPINYRFP